MKVAAAFTVVLLVPGLAAAEQRSRSGSPMKFQPKLSVGAAPPVWYAQPRADPGKVPPRHDVQAIPSAVPRGSADVEIICGMRVIRKGPEQDPGIIVRSSGDSRGAAVRRLEPQVCRGSR
jgi:hypothetical protein